MAAEYEAIAASRVHYAGLIANCGLTCDIAEQITGSPSFATLVDELRRLDATGLNTSNLLRRVAPHIEQAEDPALALTRIAAGAKPVRPHSGTPRPRLIAGLIPEATCPRAAAMRAALGQRAALIWNRAAELAQRAISDREPWLSELGPIPTDRDRRRQWQGRAATVAAYGDVWKHTGPTAVRFNPVIRRERIDAARARPALRADSLGEEPSPYPAVMAGPARRNTSLAM